MLDELREEFEYERKDAIKLLSDGLAHQPSLVGPPEGENTSGGIYSFTPLPLRRQPGIRPSKTSRRLLQSIKEPGCRGDGVGQFVQAIVRHRDGEGLRPV